MYTNCLCKMLRESKHTCLANVWKNVSEKKNYPNQSDITLSFGKTQSVTSPPSSDIATFDFVQAH